MRTEAKSIFNSIRKPLSQDNNKRKLFCYHGDHLAQASQSTAPSHALTEQLDYFGARYYASDLSIWLSVDPLADKYPSTSSFMYVLGNPIMLIDEWGLKPNFGKKIKQWFNRKRKGLRIQKIKQSTVSSKKSKHSPKPKFKRFFGLANKLRRWLSLNTGRNRNTHTFNYSFGFVQKPITWNSNKWAEVAYGSNLNGPINYYSNNKYILTINIENAGSVISGTLNGEPIDLFASINRFGQAVDKNGNLAIGGRNTGLAGDKYNFVIPSSIRYKWSALEKVKVKHSFYIWLPTIRRE